MPPSRPRRALSLSITMLAAATALGVAGCTSEHGQSGALKSLSDLPNRDQSMLKVGDTSREAGDCQAAIRFYRLAEDKAGQPEEIAAAHIGTAECELAMSALPDAQRDYEAAAKLVPQDPVPLVGLGRVDLVEHKPDEAVVYLDRAIKMGATAAYVWNDKGVAMDQLRRHKDAQQAYRQGLTFYPQDRGLRNNLALSLAMSRDFRESDGLLRALAAEPGATARTRQNLALVLGLEGDDAGARQVSEADLNGAALDNNGHFYDYARARLTGQPLPSLTDAPASSAAFEDEAAGRAAHAALDLPPVLAMKRTPRPIRAAGKAPPAQVAATALIQTAAAPIVLVTPASTMPVAATQTVAEMPKSGPVASSESEP
jgi:Flp pilus assembly protein TadD